MILANKNGWLISVTLIEESETHHKVVAIDEPNKTIIVDKNDTNRKVFDSTLFSMDEIIQFIEN